MIESIENQDPESAGGSEQHRQRLRKLDELNQAGVNPFGRRVDGVISALEAKNRFAEFEKQVSGKSEDCRKEEGDPAVQEPVTVAGRLTAIRTMGKSIFADLKDQESVLQLYIKRNEVGEENFDFFKKLDLGDIICVTGVLFRTRAGEPTLKTASFELMCKSLHPLPEKWHGLTDTEQRYRQRYLDLMVNDEVRNVFRQRSRFIQELRHSLSSRSFLEMETPMLQSIPGGAAARPFETYYNALSSPMYLRIAPELYLKRLLVGGFERVYEINRNFRNEGLDRRHNPEFTMIEIYQAYSDCRGMMELLEEIITETVERVFGTLRFPFGGEKKEEIDLTPPWRRVSFHELIREKMGEGWFSLEPAEMSRRAVELGVKVEDNSEPWQITHEIYEKLIERELIQPVFVTRLPAQLVPLAKCSPDDPSVVDVFELEIGGQEIAPGYSELNDPIEQRRRFNEQAARLRGTAEEAAGCLDEDFLAAMEYGMPPAGGTGMGIDRLLMLLTGMDSIRDVILFPQMRQQQ